MSRDYRIIDALRGFRIRHVEQFAFDAQASRAQLAHRFVEQRRVHIGQHHPCTGFSQCFDGCEANAARRAGDDRDLVVKLEFVQIHRSILRVFQVLSVGVSHSASTRRTCGSRFAGLGGDPADFVERRAA